MTDTCTSSQGTFSHHVPDDYGDCLRCDAEGVNPDVYQGTPIAGGSSAPVVDSIKPPAPDPVEARTDELRQDLTAMRNHGHAALHEIDRLASRAIDMTDEVVWTDLPSDLTYLEMADVEYYAGAIMRHLRDLDRLLITVQARAGFETE